MVGVRGNASALIDLISEEGQFVSWIVVIAVVATIGDSIGKNLAWAFLALILISFLLNDKNQKQFFKNLSQTYNHFSGVK